MAEPFIGEIKVWALPFAPKDWAICNGQTMSIAENSALFALIGTRYGGNGRTTFNLPDFRGRIAVGWDLGLYDLGQMYGFEDIILSSQQMPAHSHLIKVNDSPGQASYPNTDTEYFSNNGLIGGVDRYTTDDTNLVSLAGETMPAAAGSSLYHPNIQPSIVCNYCISLKGLFPSRN